MIEHWQRYRDVPRHLVGPRAFFEVACGEPRLLELVAFSSLMDLGLKQTADDADRTVLAWVRSGGDDRYLIAGDRRQLYSAGPVPRTVWDTEPVPGALGPAGARESVAFVLGLIG